MNFRGLKYWKEAATLALVARNGKNIAKNPPIFNHPFENTVNRTETSFAKNSKGCEVSNEGLYDYNVLMLERSSKSKFMPSAYVFPGGAVALSDFSCLWKDLFISGGYDLDRCGLPNIDQERLRSPMFSSTSDAFLNPEIALRICALRETFEESGILLYRNSKDNNTKLDKQFLKRWRSTVDKNPDKFIDLFDELKIVPDIWSLYEWSNWLTPTNMEKLHGGKRFDTAFFISMLKQSIDVVHDDKETVSSQWCTPTELLSKHKSGELWLAPPQIYEMLRLKPFEEFDGLSKYVEQRSTMGCERWMPVRITCSDITIATLPGDDMYPSNPDLTGNDPAPKLNMTGVEARQASVHLHRFEFHSASDTKFFCNIPAKYGHIMPDTIL